MEGHQNSTFSQFSQQKADFKKCQKKLNYDQTDKQTFFPSIYLYLYSDCKFKH